MFLGRSSSDVLVFVGLDKNIEIVKESGEVCGPSTHGLPALTAAYSEVFNLYLWAA